MSQPLTVSVLLKLIDKMSDPMKVAVAGSSKSLDSLGQKAESTGKQIATFANFGAAAVKGLVGAFSAYKVMDLVRDSALLSARFETMGVVMGVAGNNAGYTRVEMASLEKQMQATGISMVKSREVLTSLATANIDLAKATGLARAAQDLAVVGNLNSSEALARLVQGIKSGEVEILKTLGLNVSFEASYKKLAASLGVNTTALTEMQKVMARTDAVMAGSAAYAGIYEESLTTAGKALNSLTRYWENFKLQAGDALLPSLADGVFGLTEALKAANVELAKAGSAGTIDSIGNGLASAFRTVYETVVVLGANVAYVFSAIGREIGGIAAQAAALAHLDFAGAKFIGAEMKKDADAARLAVDAFSETIVNHSQKAAAASKTSEAARIAAGEAARKAAADEAASAAVVAAATEAKARAAKAAAAAYSHAIKASQDYIAQIQKETATLGMSDAQQALHNAVQIARTMSLAGVREKAILAFANLAAREIAASEKAAAKWAAFDREFEAAIKGQAAMVEKFDDARKTYVDGLKSAADAAAKQVETMLVEAEAMALSEELHISLAEAIELVTVKRLEEVLVVERLAGNDAAVEALQREIDARKELARLLGSKAAREASADAAKAASDDWQKTSNDIEKSLTDALLRGFEGGKDWAANFVDTLKNMFSTLVLRPLIQPIAQAGASAITGLLGMGGSGSALAGDGGGGILGMFSNGLSLNSLSGIGSNALSYGMFGTSAANAVGGNMVMAGSQQAVMLGEQVAGTGWGAGLSGSGYSAAIPGAAYAGALGGALYGYEKGGVRGGVVGGVVGYAGGAALAGGASALAAGGGVAAAGGAAMAGATAALAAIPVWGWIALAALAIFGGGKVKPSDKSGWANVDLTGGDLIGAGGLDGDKFSQENRDAAKGVGDTAAAWAGILRQLGGDIAGTVIAEVGDRDGFKASINGNGSSWDITAQDPVEFFGKLFDALTESATGLDETTKSLLLTFDGIGQEMIVFAGALVSINEYLKADPLQDVLDTIESAGKTAWGIWRDGEAAVLKMGADFDGSLQSATDLSTAVAGRYQMELGLIAQIQGLLISTSSMFGSSIEQIKLSVMDTSQQYDYWRTVTDEAYAALMIATDPAEIARLSQRGLAGANTAYGLLDETGKATHSNEFIAYEESLGALTTERLNAAQAVVIQSHNDIAAVIKTAIESAAAVMLEAANTQLAAANTPLIVDVSVDVSGDTPVASVEVNG